MLDMPAAALIQPVPRHRLDSALSAQPEQLRWQAIEERVHLGIHSQPRDQLDAHRPLERAPPTVAVWPIVVLERDPTVRRERAWACGNRDLRGLCDKHEEGWAVTDTRDESERNGHA